VVVPESEATLGGGDYAAGGHCVDGRLILKCMHLVRDELRVHELSGRLLCTIPLPELGVVSNVSGRRAHTDCFFRFESFLTPPVVYRYVPASRQLEVVMRTEVPGLNTSDLMIEQQFATSKDGTQVPLFIVRPKELLLDGLSGAALFGYGGFNVVKTITFDPVQLALLQLFAQDEGAGDKGFWRTATHGKLPMRVRGVWALANIRGGGEYGRDWHQAGTKTRKQNTFDDFIACAQLLVDRRYTSPRKLCIHGASNGGLLVTAVANQRPDLFACVVCQVGLLDMLRFHKFTIGHFWCADYGSPDDAEEFRTLLGYSPYHNVKRGSEQYPAMIFTTADHDDRVVPLHTFKMVAQLQHVIGKDPAQLRCAPPAADHRATGAGSGWEGAHGATCARAP
jgi:prolyl oligopeptidase